VWNDSINDWNNTMATHLKEKQDKLYEPLLVGGIIVVVAYALMYLLAASPVLIRALGPLLGA
jgi:hypothetical protein